MELVMQQEITEIVPASIVFNYEELKSELGIRLSRYKGIVITEKDIAEAKKDKSSLNKLVTALNDQRITQQREYMRPFDAYKAQVDDLIAMIKVVVEIIDRQLREFEENRKKEKKAALLAYFNDNVDVLSNLIPFEKIFDPRWLNATYKQADAEQEIVNTIQKVHNDLALIDKMALPCQQQMIDKYLQTLDMSAALAEKSRFEELQKNIEEAKRRAEKVVPERTLPTEEPAAAQVSASFVPVTESSVEPIAPPEVPCPIDIRVWVTGTQKVALKVFLAQNNIQYGSVK